MPHLSRPALALFAGLALLAGAACSDSPTTTTTASSETQPPSSQQSGAPSGQATTQTTVNRATGELSTADLVKLAEPSVVRVQTTSGVGTGFVVGSDGYILTNNHVVEGSNGRVSNNIRVTLSDGSVVAATAVGTDPRADLALLKIEQTGLKALKFADLDNVLIGQDVVAIGYALDLAKGEGPSYSVTRGIVSQKNRVINEGAAAQIYGAVQTDAAINHGNSGGPLLNMFGEVVGINTALAPDGSGGTATGIGFAVGSDVAQAVIDELLEDGTVDRGYLGIGPFEALRPARAKQLNVPESQAGLVVGAVAAGSPAAAGGLRANDVIIRLESVDIGSEADLMVALIRNNAGERVTIEFYRDGNKQSAEVTLGSPS